MSEYRPDVEELLRELRRRKWTMYLFGEPDAPHLYSAVYQWESCADVVLLRGEDDATAYRVPTIGDTDIFGPEHVTWQYHSSAAWTLRAVLTIERPGHPRAPGTTMRPDPLCAVPIAIRRPLTIRPTAR